MKRMIVTIFLIALFSSLIEYFLPWWSLAIPCFFISMIARLSKLKSFVAGFLGISFSWLTLIVYKDIANHHLLSEKLANLFQLNGHYMVFVTLCVFIGGCVGGLSSLSGQILNPKN